MTKFIYIYTLTDPRDGLIHYVGKTNNPQRRKYEHQKKTTRKHGPLYAPWHESLLASGLQPIFNILEEVVWPGIVAEKTWMKKLREEGHPLVNSNRYVPGKISEQTFRGVVIKSAQQIRQEQAQRIQARWRKWWDSLPPEEKSRRQRAKVNEKSKQGGRDFWANMTPEERKEFVRRRMEKMSPENKIKVFEGWKQR
jgi:hypothetical protein